MHELSLASAIVDTVERHAGGRRVETISLSIGVLRQVVPASLELYVGIVGRDTVCENARLELAVIPARVECCGESWEPPSFRCARCGAAAELVAGNEFLVESIEIAEEVPDACIART